ncbi:hypothetical protein DB30_02721 [Enhygromyxa salina]|uniref:Uncharacterized protein n=1 Tax=Enhygromyxa salina TaxID=215803 RepID=A0A0C2DDC1_9BACT|nr:hypothetical protein DB30_02721 [Enhygromyxa salina]
MDASEPQRDYGSTGAAAASKIFAHAETGPGSGVAGVGVGIGCGVQTRARDGAAWMTSGSATRRRVSLAIVAQGLTRASLLAFRDRGWARVRSSKEAFWAEDTRVRGPMAGLLAGAALWEHARLVEPTWPTDEARKSDLEHHVVVAEKVRRIAHVFVRN